MVDFFAKLKTQLSINMVHFYTVLFNFENIFSIDAPFEKVFTSRILPSSGATKKYTEFI